MKGKMETIILLIVWLMLTSYYFIVSANHVEDLASSILIWKEVIVLITTIIAFHIAVTFGIHICRYYRRPQQPMAIYLPERINPICAIPRLKNKLQKTFSLVPDIINSKYNVHIISCFQGDMQGSKKFLIHVDGKTIDGFNIDVEVEVKDPDSRPIILIFVSNQPVNWLLETSAEIYQVELISDHELEGPNITYVGDPTIVNKAIRVRNIPTGFGDDSTDGDTAAMMYYVMSKYGTIASFTGCYSASRWLLNLSGGRQTPMHRADIDFEDKHPLEKEDMVILESHLLYHEYLGGGASGEVFRASWKTKYHGVMAAAAKKVRITEEYDLKEINKEVDMLRKLNHPNIIKLFGTITTTKHLVIVTEFASKGSLQSFVRKINKLPNDLFKAWVLQAALGIQYSHNHDIVHCDIKPSNYVVSKNFVLKLCDLGIAMHLTHTTDTPAGRGTIKYLAPEVFRDNRRSPACDVYSYGFVVWVLLTCKSPYEGWIPERVQWNVGYEDFRPEIPADCPNMLRTLITNCWHANYKKRPNIDFVVKVLEGL